MTRRKKADKRREKYQHHGKYSARATRKKIDQMHNSSHPVRVQKVSKKSKN